MASVEKACESDIIACQFHKWYHLFARATFKSRIIPLPTEFIDYLGEEGVILPISSKNYFATDALSDDEDDNLRELEDSSCGPMHDFNELDNLIATAIEELSGEVIAKVNWSCPSDAMWANGGSLKCRSPSDIYMLLKSSDRVVFDLENMYDLCCPHKLPKDEVKLVLRKWANLNPAMEFRVFVHDKIIVGICQRDCCTYYDFLESKLDHLQDLIYNAFYGLESGSKATLGKAEKYSIRETFPLDHYTIDVYIDLKDRVWIVDFNPFGEPTCSLLFEWGELLITTPTTGNKSSGDIAMDSTVARAIGKVGAVSDLTAAGLLPQHDFCEFRIIESAGEVLQSTKGTSRGPIDVHAASEFKNFIDICKVQQAVADEDEESCD